MKIRPGRARSEHGADTGGIHLTYCSNIHAGERWPDVADALAQALPRVRALVAADGPFAVGLRLSADAAATLEAPPALQSFREFLRASDCYVPTINGFPYGAFHGTRVKEQVYQPDWRHPARVDYTNRLARILASLLADAKLASGSISTVPCAFRTEIRAASDVDACARHVLTCAAFLKRLRDETGISVALALEPEPACYLETIDEAASFFGDHLLSRDLRASVAAAGGVTLDEDDVRRHVGVCLDACHMAVEFEEPAAAIARLTAAGIRIPKIQLSSALRVSGPAGHRREALAPFAEDTYLHQVVAAGEDGLRRYVDLPDALDDEHGSAHEWRIHFHVPIFADRLGAFETTQAYLASVIEIAARTGCTECLEVETYTWDVLPLELRTTDVCTAIARELTWVQSQFVR